uniref:Uncharacterized protein n=1 Tax=Dulem virus 58 TaxID=3145769 RepID=A0AAU8B2X6_9VIRU
MLRVDFEISDLYQRLYDIEMEIEDIQIWLHEESESQRERSMLDIEGLLAEKSDIEAQIAHLRESAEAAGMQTLYG